jgi:formylglycine-generating enzyme required for sulfatase activity
VLAALLASGCGFPDFEVTSDATNDGSADGTTGDADTGNTDAFVATGDARCGDGAVVQGAVQSCVCGVDAGGAEAAANDGGDDGAPIDDATTGLQICQATGTESACVGCVGDPTAACAGTVVPIGTTCVPGAIVSIGSKNPGPCGTGACAVESPRHAVALTRFAIDVREVTVGQFRTWWETGHAPPSTLVPLFVAGDGTPISWSASWTIREPTTKSATVTDATWLGTTVATDDAYPLNYVDWSTALAYCASTGGRLATEAEWETAASGEEERLYPWFGPNTEDEAAVATDLDCAHAISSVGSATHCGFPGTPTTKGSSTLDGAFDLSGSVAEWVLDVAPAGGAACTSGCYPSMQVDPVAWSAGATQHGVRGGSYVDTDPVKLRSTARAFADATTPSASIGFRCVHR